MEVNVYNMAGEVVGQVNLSDRVFNVDPNPALVHQVAVAQMANARAGTASTKTRGEVAGGGRKPWRQKGTGRARAGSTRAPHWRGGGVVFGPHPRSYTQAVPRKMRRQALRVLLSSKAHEGRLVLLDQLSFEQPKTKEAAALLDRLHIEKSVLLLTPGVDQNVVLSARNLPKTAALPAQQLGVVDALKYEYLVLPVDAARQIEQILGDEAAEEGVEEPEVAEMAAETDRETTPATAAASEE